MYLVKTQGQRLAVTCGAGRLWCQVAFRAAVHVAALPVSALARVLNTLFCKMAEKRCMKYEEYFDAKLLKDFNVLKVISVKHALFFMDCGTWNYFIYT